MFLNYLFLWHNCLGNCFNSHSYMILQVKLLPKFWNIFESLLNYSHTLKLISLFKILQKQQKYWHANKPQAPNKMWKLYRQASLQKHQNFIFNSFTIQIIAQRTKMLVSVAQNNKFCFFKQQTRDLTFKNFLQASLKT